MTLSVADTTSSPSVATPSQPDLEESLNLNSVKKMPASKVVNVEVHDESFSNFVRKDRKDLDESAIVTSPEITQVTNPSQDVMGEFLKLEISNYTPRVKFGSQVLGLSWMIQN